MRAIRHTLRPSRLISCFAALAGVVVCSGTPVEAAPPRSATVVAPGPSCAQEVDALQGWLDGLLLDPGVTEEPPVSSIEVELRAAVSADEREQDERLVNIFWDLTEACPTATVAFSLVARSAGDEKMAVLVDHLPRGVRDCGCAIDVPALRSFMWELDQRLNPALQDD